MNDKHDSMWSCLTHILVMKCTKMHVKVCTYKYKNARESHVYTDMIIRTQDVTNALAMIHTVYTRLADVMSVHSLRACRVGATVRRVSTTAKQFLINTLPSSNLTETAFQWGHFWL